MSALFTQVSAESWRVSCVWGEHLGEVSMLQVKFSGLLPTADLVAQVSAACAALRAQDDTRGGACLSVTLSRRDAPEPPYAVVVELVDAAGAVTRAETAAHQLTFALRSALSVTCAGSVARLVNREYERRRAVRTHAAQRETSSMLACVGT
jgi:hypothetical protein